MDLQDGRNGGTKYKILVEFFGDNGFVFYASGNQTFMCRTIYVRKGTCTLEISLAPLNSVLKERCIGHTVKQLKISPPQRNNESKTKSGIFLYIYF